MNEDDYDAGWHAGRRESQIHAAARNVINPKPPWKTFTEEMPETGREIYVLQDARIPCIMILDAEEMINYNTAIMWRYA